MHEEILENNDCGDGEREETPEGGPTCSTVIKNFRVSLLETFHCFQIIMLTIEDETMRLKHKSQMLCSPLLTLERNNAITRKVNWKNTLTWRNKQLHISSSRKKRSPFIDDEAEEDSFREIDSDYDDVTITYIPLMDLSLPRSTSISDLQQPKRRRILKKFKSY